jgi:ATP-dependent DNA helicase RecG
LIHGRLPAAEKAETMNQFKAGEIDLLVATTVIEVGVDVPNASLMVIENSERLGLAQLHQLRGRIGRGKAQSHCLLLYHSPLGETSRQRLNVLRESNDGFHIAEMDLQIRGPGELFGSRQSGSLQFRIADLLRDHHMLDDIARIANQLLRNDQISARAIIERWIVSPEEFSQA